MLTGMFSKLMALFRRNPEPLEEGPNRAASNAKLHSGSVGAGIGISLSEQSKQLENALEAIEVLSKRVGASLNGLDSGAFGSQVFEHLETKLDRLIEGKFKASLREELESIVRAELSNDLRNEVRGELMQEMRSEKEHLMRIFREGMLLEHVKTREIENVRCLVWNQLKREIKESVKDELRRSVEMECRDEVLADLRKDIEARYFNQMASEIERSLEKEMRPRIARDLRTKVAGEVRESLKRELKPVVEKELRLLLITSMAGGSDSDSPIGPVLKQATENLKNELRESILDEIWGSVTISICESLAVIIPFDDEEFEFYLRKASELVDDRIVPSSFSKDRREWRSDGFYRALAQTWCHHTGNTIQAGEYYAILRGISFSTHLFGPSRSSATSTDEDLEDVSESPYPDKERVARLEKMLEWEMEREKALSPDEFADRQEATPSVYEWFFFEDPV